MSQPVSASQALDVYISEFISAVRQGLAKHPQKSLDSRYLYDSIGSSLFEVITLLPEYGVTRADARLIERHATKIANRMGPDVVVAELGSGDGSKTYRIVDALKRNGPLVYRPIDVSLSALERCQKEFTQLDNVEVEPLQLSYVEGLRVAIERTPKQKRLLLLFLGGTIGNFDRPAISDFLKDLRAFLRRGDAFLIGADLEKAKSRLLSAYDDPLGVTAAFNLNLLARINRELEGDFDLARFEHVARYDESKRRIEMHLRARTDLTARISTADLEINMREGETIWTESSHKFRVGEIAEFAEDCGFRCAAEWVDPEWPFSETLLIAA